MLPNEETSHAAAAMSSRQRTILSQVLQDLRQTLSHMRLPKVSPLSALDATAIDALKDLYYLSNTEDPLNTMPIRRHILQINVCSTLLLPLLTLLHSDKAANTNPKRWSVPVYHSLRILSVLTSPVLRENGLLPQTSSLDDSLLHLRGCIAGCQPVIDAYVALLQYYLDRKARKADALAAAEESKLEDARIDNILRFFRNLLSPPRASAGEHLRNADKGVHFAVVNALVKADFYSTVSILFASKEDARSQYTDLIFIVAEIYALTFRHSTPKQAYQAHRRSVSEKARAERGDRLSVQQDIHKRRSAGLRAALQRERAFVGGSRAVRASTRWTSRHSGGFTVAPKEGAKATSKKIISARTAIQENLIFNPKRPLQDAIHINSEILCLLTAKGRSKSGVVHKKVAAPLKQDAMEEGLRGIVGLSTEMVEICFEYFVRELRERIEETKQRSKADETETLMTAQKSFVAIVGTIVGFHRERYGKIRRDTTKDPPSLNAQLHGNSMQTVLLSDFKIIKKEWKAVQAGIELETFQLVFRVLVDSCEALRESGKDTEKAQIVELSTSAVLEMMKMLQGMAANSKTEDEVQSDQETDKKPNLTPREIALNTLEQLFERQSFLNAPAELAKDFSTKTFSFRHLTNIVEVAHAFTTILLDEAELARLQVTKKKRSKAKKQKQIEEKNEKEKSCEESDPEFKIDLKDGQANDKEDSHGTQTNGNGEEARVKKKNKIVESDDEADNEAAVADKQTMPRASPADSSDARQSSSTAASGETPSAGGEVRALTEDKSHKDLEAPEERDVQQQLITDADEEVTEPLKDNTASTGESAKKLSRVQELLLADATRKHEGPSSLAKGRNAKMAKDFPEQQPLSNVQLMLMADKKSEPSKPDNPNASKLSTVQNMLLADANEENKETEMPKLVSTVEEMRRDMMKEKANADGTVPSNVANEGEQIDAGSDDSEEEPELREIESIGIIRRFAHAKALQTLVLPVRAALCEASSLSGTSQPIPEGSSPLLSPIVIAKSAHVLAAIWRVAKIRERGVQCGQFFSYSTMHLMNIALTASRQKSVLKDSVLERFSVFAKDVTKEFFSWLAINPGLTLDMFFPMDKGSCNMYVSFIRQKALADAHQTAGDDSGNESDLSLLEIEKREENAAANGAERPRSSNHASRVGKRRMHERRRAEREKIEEDEDVDDIDNLDLGIDEGNGEISADCSEEKTSKKNELPDDFIEDSPVAGRSRRAKRTRKQKFDPFDSDDEHLQGRMRKKRVTKTKKSRNTDKGNTARKPRESKKPTFESSDEYSDIEIDNDMDLSDTEAPPVRKLKLNFSESPDMLDEDEDNGEEDSPVSQLETPASKSQQKDTRVLATRVSDSPLREAKSRGKENDNRPSAESDIDSGGPPSEKSTEISDDSPTKDQAIIKGSDPSSVSGRKSRRVVVSDDESE